MMMPSEISQSAILVRPIQTGDAEVAADLALQLGYSRSAEAIGAWIQSMRDRAGQATFVASLDNHVVAWIEVSVQQHLQSEPYALITGLVVRDGLRGRGIGRLLLRHAEQWAWDHGVQTVRVTSRSTREDAHRFYRQDGYKDTKLSLVFEKTGA
jgi:GNAT superfamily N-acetyltransferase